MATTTGRPRACQFSEQFTEGRMLDNDSTATCIGLDLVYNEMFVDVAKRCGLALQNTKHVKFLVITLDMHKSRDHDDDDEERDTSRDVQASMLLLFQWLTTSASLEELDVLGSYTGAKRTIADALMPWLLGAVINRRFHPTAPPLRYLKIYNIDLLADQVIELVESSKLQHLILYNCSFLTGRGHPGVYSGPGYDAPRIGRAFAGNTSLRTLEIGWTRHNSECIGAIITSLRSHCTLQKLKISCKTNDDSSVVPCPAEIQSALLTLFCSAHPVLPLRSLHFMWMGWTNEILFRIIQGIKASHLDIQEVGFQRCAFVKGSLPELTSLFDGTSKAHRLWLGDGNSIYEEEWKQVVATSTGLRELYFQECGRCCIRGIVEGLKTKECRVHTVQSDNSLHCNFFYDGLPYIQCLKHVGLESDNTVLKRRILNAFKNNSSVVTATIKGTELCPEDHALLQSYQARNAQGPKLLQDITKPGARLGLFPRLLLSTVDATRVLNGSSQPVLSTVLDCSEHVGDLATAQPADSVESSPADNVESSPVYVNAGTANKRLKLDSSSSV